MQAPLPLQAADSKPKQYIERLIRSLPATGEMPGGARSGLAERTMIVEAGDEIGLHGYSHEIPIAMTPDQEEAVLDRCDVDSRLRAMTASLRIASSRASGNRQDAYGRSGVSGK